MSTWVPVTPGGTVCIHLESATEEEAWAALLEDAAHMPYGTKENFIKRGYTVEKYDESEFEPDDDVDDEDGMF